MSDIIGRLQDKLASEIAWRKKEIVALRISATRASASQRYFCRAGAVILCAHWEGFLRAAIQHYVDFVFAQQLPIKTLSPKFVAISFYKDIKGAAEADFPGSENHCVKLARRLLEGIDIPAPKPRWRVETGGNPSSTVTSRLLLTVGLSEKLGLDEAEWATAKVFIDEQILRERHKIAHGEGLLISHGDFKVRSERILSMCESLVSLIMRSALSEDYRVKA